MKIIKKILFTLLLVAFMFFSYSIIVRLANRLKNASILFTQFIVIAICTLLIIKKWTKDLNTKGTILFLFIALVVTELSPSVIMRINNYVSSKIDAYRIISEWKLNEKEKNEMNYENLKDDVYMLVWKGTPIHAKKKFQFQNVHNINIPTNYESISIDKIDLNHEVIGGIKPYKFSKVEGPAWIEVSEDGIITGTPVEEGKNENLVVKVEDSNDEYKQLSFIVNDTLSKTTYVESKEKESSWAENLMKYAFGEKFEDEKYYGDGYNIKEELVTEARNWSIYKGTGNELIGSVNVSYGPFKKPIMINLYVVVMQVVIVLFAITKFVKFLIKIVLKNKEEKK